MRRRESAHRPSVRVIVEIEQRVFLLQTKPRLVVSMSRHELGCFVTGVKLIGRPVGVVALAEDENVLPSLRAKGIVEDGSGFQLEADMLASGAY